MYFEVRYCMCLRDLGSLGLRFLVCKMGVVRRSLQVRSRPVLDHINELPLPLASRRVWPVDTGKKSKERRLKLGYLFPWQKITVPVRWPFHTALSLGLASISSPTASHREAVNTPHWYWHQGMEPLFVYKQSFYDLSLHYPIWGTKCSQPDPWPVHNLNK